MFLKQNKLFVISGAGFFLFSFIESWRITRLTSSPSDLVFSYSTYPIVSFVLLAYCFFAILARYKLKYNKTHTLLKLIYLPSMFSLMVLGYLLGLNFDSFIGTNDAVNYLFVFPVWVNVGLIVFTLSIYIFAVYRFLNKKRVVVLLTTLMSIVLFLLFTSLVTTYTMQFDVF